MGGLDPAHGSTSTASTSFSTPAPAPRASLATSLWQKQFAAVAV